MRFSITTIKTALNKSNL